MKVALLLIVALAAGCRPAPEERRESPYRGDCTPLPPGCDACAVKWPDVESLRGAMMMLTRGECGGFHTANVTYADWGMVYYFDPKTNALAGTTMVPRGCQGVVPKSCTAR